MAIESNLGRLLKMGSRREKICNLLYGLFDCLSIACCHVGRDRGVCDPNDDLVEPKDLSFTCTLYQLRLCNPVSVLGSADSLLCTVTVNSCRIVRPYFEMCRITNNFLAQTPASYTNTRLDFYFIYKTPIWVIYEGTFWIAGHLRVTYGP